MYKPLVTGSYDYFVMHREVRKVRGNPESFSCTECELLADVWAWIHDKDPYDVGSYQPMCRSHHIKYDYTDEWRDVNRGTNSHNNKLSEDQVREIRRLGDSKQYRHWQIAEMFGVSKKTVTNIINRKGWSWLT